MTTERYVVEVLGFLDWEPDQEFPNRGQARLYAESAFEHNSWRVRKLATNEVVFEHRAEEGMAADAEAGLIQIERTARFIQNREEERQRRRLQAVAVRQRQASERQEMDRLRRMAFEMASGDAFPIPASVRDKVNWLREGF